MLEESYEITSGASSYTAAACKAYQVNLLIKILLYAKHVPTGDPHRNHWHTVRGYDIVKSIYEVCLEEHTIVQTKVKF